ncbi:MAG TPA: ribonuclease Z [Flavobacteriales bacterium]|nr:ribonuclease Z [Flavobacteriales bacterium]HRO38569.1 ribonuclease Z [Flavobacteriales bacterium]HRP80838.1 ribonuclease Z [Flavobacteriales bacterium]HRQ84009.1 ribonuclease Z [Flavobacteriales bacterium]
MRFEVTTLGTGAALPARGRYPSAQLLNVHERLFLIDCGEGTQERLRMAQVNMGRIARVMISHLHGDHYLGLMGLISSMHLQGRTAPLDVHGPADLRQVIDLQLRVSGTFLRFPLKFHPLEHRSGALVFQDDRVEVAELALKHRIDSTGFLFREAGLPRKLIKEKVELIPHYARQAVKMGQDLVLPGGGVVPNEQLTAPPPKQRSYAYCSDTAFLPELVPFLHGVDLLYHEATFAAALADRAKETMHSTAGQAATIAREAGAGQLLLGHFSSRYKDVQVLYNEAAAIFPNTLMACEGCTFQVGPVHHAD